MWKTSFQSDFDYTMDLQWLCYSTVCVELRHSVGCAALQIQAPARQSVISFKMWHVSTLNYVILVKGNINLLWHIFQVKCCSWVCIYVVVLSVRMSAVSSFCSFASLAVCVILNQDIHYNKDSSAMAVSLPLRSFFSPNPVVQSYQTQGSNSTLFCIFWFVVVLFAIYFIHVQKYINMLN